MKRIISILLAVCMIVSVVPTQLMAEENVSAMDSSYYLVWDPVLYNKAVILGADTGNIVVNLSTPADTAKTYYLYSNYTGAGIGEGWRLMSASEIQAGATAVSFADIATSALYDNVYGNWGTQLAVVCDGTIVTDISSSYIELASDASTYSIDLYYNYSVSFGLPSSLTVPGDTPEKYLTWDPTLSNKAMILGSDSASITITLDQATETDNTYDFYYYEYGSGYREGWYYVSSTVTIPAGSTEITIDVWLSALYDSWYGNFDKYFTLVCNGQMVTNITGGTINLTQGESTFSIPLYLNENASFGWLPTVYVPYGDYLKWDPTMVNKAQIISANSGHVSATLSGALEADTTYDLYAYRSDAGVGEGWVHISTVTALAGTNEIVFDEYSATYVYDNAYGNWGKELAIVSNGALVSNICAASLNFVNTDGTTAQIPLTSNSMVEVPDVSVTKNLVAQIWCQDLPNYSAWTPLTQSDGYEALIPLGGTVDVVYTGDAWRNVATTDGGNFQYGVKLVDGTIDYNNGTVGDITTFTYQISDVTFKADGYEDYVAAVSGTYTALCEVYEPAWGGVAGNTHAPGTLDFSEVAGGSDGESITAYLNSVTEVTFSVTYISHEVLAEGTGETEPDPVITTLNVPLTEDNWSQDAGLDSTIVTYNDDGSVTADGIETFAFALPKEVPVGETVSVNIKGTSDGNFRAWLMAPWEARMSNAFNASAIGFESGEFDFTFELTAEDADGVGNTSATSIQFKAPSYDTLLENITLTSVTVTYGIVDPEPILDNTTLLVQVYAQDTDYVAWTALGLADGYRDTLTLGETIDVVFTGDAWREITTNDSFTVGLNVVDLGITVGSTAKIKYTVSDITFKADGYDDYVVPVAGTYEEELIGYLPSWGPVAGNNSYHLIDFTDAIGDTQLVDYLNSVTEVSLSIAFDEYDYDIEPTNAYTLTFDANGGSGTMDDIILPSGIWHGMPECTFTPPAGMMFNGWTATLADGSPYTGTVSSDVTFVANWVIDPNADLIASGTCGDNLTWELTNDGTLTISGEGEMYDYGFVGDAIVVTPWNEYRDQIEKVIINDGVTSIGNYAFVGIGTNNGTNIMNTTSLSNLRDVEIPSTVISIGNHAFNCSSLTGINIPNSVTSIGDYAFSRCTSLTSITIPERVISIGDHAFEYCSSLTSINVSESNQYYADDCGVLFDKEFTTLLEYPEGKNDTLYTIPEGVTSIDDYAFSGSSSLISIVIPDSVIRLGDFTFESCSSLTNVIIPSGVTNIGQCTFLACTSLANITIPEGVTLIESNAFNGCSSLTSVMIPENVQYINYSAFGNCTNLKSIEVDVDNCYYMDIDGVLFDESGTTLLQFPAAFGPEYIVPDGVTSIGDFAFDHCENLLSITIPEGVTSIGNWAFYCCSGLTSITIPRSVANIGNSAFDHCISLMSVVISESVTNIERCAFLNCYSLASITFLSSTTEIYDDEWTISDTAVIHGYTGSTAEAYAEKYGRTFIALDEPEEEKTGNINGDEKLDNMDAIHLLYHSIYPDDENYAVSEDCDYNRDGTVDRKDALLLLYHIIFGSEIYPLR